MTGLDATLQRLVETEQARGKVHGLLLHVRSADGRLNFKGAAGAADPDIRFAIASVSKMFTAALIVQLCDEGALDLDQSVQSALPGVDLGGLHVVKGIDYGPKLTIRQLLFQTSGLADYYEGGVARDLIRSKDYAYDLSDVLAWAKALPRKPRRTAGARTIPIRTSSCSAPWSKRSRACPMATRFKSVSAPC